MAVIKDGTGSGYTVRVGSSQKLDTSARVNDRIYYASRDSGKAFVVQFELTQAVDGVTEGVGYIKYTGNDRLNIKQIAFTSEDAGMTKFGVWKSPTVSGGATATPTNLNFGSNIPSDTTCKEDNDGTTVTITGGTSIFTLRLNGPDTKVVEFFDAIIMGPDDILGIKGNATTATSKVRVNIMFAESVD